MSSNKYHVDKDCIYFDNNGSAIMPREAIDIIAAWCNKGNPSASNKAAKECEKLMREMTLYLLSACNTTPNIYDVFFTSGATESNSTIIRTAATSWITYKKTIPHIITSGLEHKSILMVCEQLEEQGMIELTKIHPMLSGHINPRDIELNIRDNTCLISIMAANNEIGSINDISAIGKIARARGIPFHCDAVQTFGKHPINLSINPVAAFSISFHKYGGPPGIGALIVRKDFHAGYKLCPLICGTQNFGFRGGTENIIGIASSYRALKIYWDQRVSKNNHLFKLKKYFINKLNDIAPTMLYTTYFKTAQQIAQQNMQQIQQSKTAIKKFPNKYIVLISGPTDNYLCNTCLISIITDNKDICNAKIKQILEDNNIICSVGSACNTNNKYASHVLDEILSDETIKRGTLRFSFGDQNTINEIDYTCQILSKILK